MKVFVVLQLAALLLVQEAASQTAPTTLPADYSLIIRDPADCEPSACNVFVGVNLNEGNDDYLDFYLEAEADGYVAAGFSDSQSMFSADVVFCARNPADDSVEARDSWNEASPTRNNTIDTTQDIMTFNTSYSNGRIQCSVAKRITGSDANQDIDLNTDLFMLYARLPGDLTNFPSIQNHGGGNRAVSQARVTLPAPPPTTMPTTQGPPVAPTDEPTDYSITLRNPAGCEPAVCNIFVGVNVNEANDGYLDIYLEAEADGYVAVGFSDSRNMFDADVVFCARNPAGDSVEARDSWNAAPTDRVNTIDATQDIMTFSASYSNGRIQCSVAKRIIGSDANQDIDLNTDLFMLYARLPGDLTNFPILQNHGPANRNVSGMRFTLPPPAATEPPATTEGAKSLHSVHVIVMLAAALLAVCLMAYY